MPKSNRKIDFLLMSADWHIDAQWGLQQLNNYLSELDYLEAGGKIDHSAKRAESKMTILTMDGFGNEDGGSDSNSAPVRIAHHRLSGVMRLEGGLSSQGVNSLAADLRNADNNDSVSGHLLEINSGGGEAMAGQVLMNAISELNKPIYVYGHMIGSAALMAALPANKIILSGEQARIGSIGSYISIDKKMLNEYKENMVDIYSDHSPNKNKEFRQFLKDDIKPLLRYVNKSAEIFQNTVTNYRHLPSETREDTLKGATFMAEEGIERGLADGIDTFNNVVSSLIGEIQSAGEASNSIDNLNIEQQMKFSDFFASARDHFNRIFGWSLAEDATAETVIAQMAEQQSITDAVNAAVLEKLDAVNSQLAELSTKYDTTVTKLNETLAHLEGAQNEILSLQEEMATMNEERESRESHVATLEAEIAQLKGAPALEGQEEYNPNNTVASFQKNLSALQLEGDSKY